MREHYEQSPLSKRVLDNIRYLAALNNMTQADLAKRMRISPSYISEIFGAKKSAFYPTIIERAAETFGITPGMLLDYDFTERAKQDVATLVTERTTFSAQTPSSA